MGTLTLNQRLDRIARRTPTAQIGVRAPHLGVDFAAGSPLPFHAASVGKLVTTALVARQFDAGCLRPETPAVEVLGVDELRGLVTDPFAVTVQHLLSHLSGVPDYFEGRVTSGVPVVKEAVAHPGRRWTPAELLAVSRERQRPLGRPGEKFSYSDTGFVLLGRVLEEITGAPFETLVHREVADPLGLSSMFLPYRTTPAAGSTEIRPVFIGRTDVSRSPSLTCDWAGGGIAATMDDWMTFGAALFGGRLVTPETLAFLREPHHRFRAGLEYGAGVMTVRFEEFTPWLRGWPRLVGHIGVSAAHLWHDPETGSDIALNLGSTRAMVRSFRLLFGVVGALRKAG